MTENAGSKLRDARQNRSLSLEQVSESLHIKKSYLEAMEQGDYSLMSTQVQLRGFLRSYADFLGLDSKELLESIFPSVTPPATPVSEDHPQPQEKIEQDSPKENSAAIYTEIGKILFERRDLLSLTIEEVEGSTHIPKHYLKLLEAGKFDRFPSPTQARGMLGNYATFLNLDPDSLALRYAEGIQSEFVARKAEVITAPSNSDNKSKPRLPFWLRSFVSADFFFVVLLGLAIIVFFVWGLNRVGATRTSQAVAPTAPSIADVLLPTSTLSPAATAPPELIDIDPSLEETAEPQNQPDSEDIEAALNPDRISIVLIVRQSTWLRVTVDGKVELDGRVSTGDTLSFSATDQIELLTGNAAAIQVFFNDQDLGILGVLGQVVDIIYTKNGPIAPTPTLVPTATATPIGADTPEE